MSDDDGDTDRHPLDHQLDPHSEEGEDSAELDTDQPQSDASSEMPNSVDEANSRQHQEEREPAGVLGDEFDHDGSEEGGQLPPQSDEEEPDAAVTSEIIRDLAAVQALPMHRHPHQRHQHPQRHPPIDELLNSRPPSPAPVAVQVIAAPVSLSDLRFPTPPPSALEAATREVELLEAELTTPIALAATTPAQTETYHFHQHHAATRNSSQAQHQQQPPSFHPHPHPSHSPEDHVLAAEAASVISDMHSSSLLGSSGYTDLLRVVALRAEQSARERAERTGPKLRQVLVDGIEQARMEQVTDNWIKRHHQAQGAGDKEAERRQQKMRQPAGDTEEQKDAASSPFSPYKPSRSRPTILANSVLSASPSAPRIAGVASALSTVPPGQALSSDSPSTHGIASSSSRPPTDYRQNQLSRQQKAVQRAESRKLEPFFQPPSVSPVSAFSKAHHPRKAPLAVAVASSSFAFYASANASPIQVEFPPKYEPFPRAMDMQPFQQPHHHQHQQHHQQSPRRRQMMQVHQYQQVHQTTTTSATVQHEQQFYAQQQSHHQQQQQQQQQQQPSAVEYAQPFSASVRIPPNEGWQPTHVAPFVIPSSPRSNLLHRQPPHHPHMSLATSPVPLTPLSPRSPRYANRTPAAPGVTGMFHGPLSLSHLSSALVRTSEYATDVHSEIRPLFSSYHSYKSTLLKKKANVTDDVEEHARAHLHHTETKRRDKRGSTTAANTAAQVMLIDR